VLKHARTEALPWNLTSRLERALEALEDGDLMFAVGIIEDLLHELRVARQVA
jgi:hypothetical protein